MNLRFLRPLLLTFLVIAYSHQGSHAAQQVDDALATSSFDVVSVKPNSSDGRRGIRSTRGRFVGTNQPLSRYILEAYGVLPHELVDAPDWIFRERFDIEATLPDGTLIRRVVQPRGGTRFLPPIFHAILEERFGLRVRWETREGQIYRLVRTRPNGELGPHLRRVATDCTPQPPKVSPCSLGGFTNGRNVGYGAVGVDWPGYLVGHLVERLRTTVLDETGLSGPFDVRLEWTPDLTPSGGDAAAMSEAVSLFTALQEQLGLKLEPARGPVDVLVIEHVQRPTAN